MAAEMASDSGCGACGEQCSNVHSCMLSSVVPTHVVPLHSHVMCSSVVMPIEGYYFCGMGCLHTYNTCTYMVDSVNQIGTPFSAAAMAAATPSGTL